jgi:DNA/RNA-binding domain of Phe-tRNA-synthetase-like protein
VAVAGDSSRRHVPAVNHAGPVADPLPARIGIAAHPLLRIACFTTSFPAPLGDLRTPAEVRALLTIDAPAPVGRDEALRVAIRDLLRSGGYKPTGRGKPASEYLVRAAREGALQPINLAVDVCNAISLRSGLPVSVVDRAQAKAPFRIAVAAAGSRYVFNAAGQEIELGGLLCLFDAEGPCATAVRDSQRTKTNFDTRVTLSIIWATRGFEGALRRAEAEYRTLLEHGGATTATVRMESIDQSLP